jgi:heptosyltransferase II
MRRLPGPDAPLVVRDRRRARGDGCSSARALARARRSSGFAPGAAYGHAKRWPPGASPVSSDGSTAERGATCVLVGAEGDREAGREIESALPAASRVVNLIGRTDLRLLAGVLARCSAFVSNDSGAMHLAAALGVPVTRSSGRPTSG